MNYDQIPDANQIYMENEKVNAAIAAIDAGAMMTTFSIGSPPVTEGQPLPPMMMTSSIMVPPPVDAETMAALRAWLVSRSADLVQQLADAGVLAAPPAAA